MTNEELERAVERAMKKRDHPSSDTLGFTTLATADFDTIMKALSERAELLAAVERMRDCLLGIALSDRYRRYPKQHEDGGIRGQSGLRAVRALTGQHGSYLSDKDVVRLDKEARAALTTGEGK